MKSRLFLGTIALLSITWISGCTKQKETSPTASTTQAAHEDPEGYYTCPMHPQVHEHEPGKCPICHMPLVHVSGKKQEADQTATISGHEVHATDGQLNLAGIGKYTVQRKDLVFAIPVSGRLISPRNVVFQVYESDLQVIRTGLEFSGRAAFSPEEELKGQIRQVDTLIDPSSRTVRVLGSLSGSSKRTIVDGAFHGEIRSTAKNQIAIPEDAILHTGQKNLVYIITQDNQLRPVTVTLGKKAAREYQVLSGLREGDVISTGPNFLIDSESKIRGVSTPQGEGKPSTPSCPKGQHWDVPMNMCMPGEG